MPYADFQPSNAGAQLNDQILKNVDFGTSLMERAQRMQISAADAEMKKSDFASNLATTALNQDNLRAELALRKINLAETERKTSSLAKLRDEFSSVSADLDKALDFVRQERDPTKQHQLFTRLSGDAAKYYSDPEIKAVLDRKFSVVQSSIAENEASALTNAVRENRVNIDEQAARFKFPGQAISTFMDPASGRPLFVATGKPDPSAEARAMDILSTADTPEELKAALADPSVVLMRGVSGSAVTKTYMARRDLFAKEAALADLAAGKITTATNKANAAAGKQDKLPQFMVEQSIKLTQASEQLKGIETDFAKMSTGPVLGFFRDLNVYDDDAQTFKARLTAMVPNLARGVFGEVGVLTDFDVANYLKTLPNLKTPQARATALVGQLREVLMSKQKLLDGFAVGQNYNRGGMPGPGTAPPPPTVVSGNDLQAMLREQQARKTRRTP